VQEYRNNHVSFADEAPNNVSADTDGKSVAPSVEEGIVYKRTDKNTGREYIGQTKSPERFKERQYEHKHANPDADCDFDVIGHAKPEIDLDILEQQMINEYGGLRNKGGKLENKRNQVSKKDGMDLELSRE
jgi:hypothetical protein